MNFLKKYWPMILLLLAVSLGAKDKPKAPTITFNGHPNSGFYTRPIQSISYSKCDVCGRDVPEPVPVIILPINFWDKAKDKAFKKSILPYTKGEYRICWRCILETIRVKPPEVKP